METKLSPLQKAVSVMKFDDEDTIIKFLKMAELFELALPTSLTWTHYELYEEYREYPFTYADWGEFLTLESVVKFLQKENLAILSAASRKQLQKLDETSSTAAVQAAKAISQEVREATGAGVEQTKVIYSYVPKPEFQQGDNKEDEED